MKNGFLSIFAIFCLGLISSGAQAQSINILDATYGQNCGAYYGNATNDVRYFCGASYDCQYPVSVQRLGDPAPGCTKDFTVQYQCGLGAPVQTVTVFPEANGKIANLSCIPYSGGVSVISATYGGNVGAAYGNVTASVAATCAGRLACTVYISTSIFGDPVPGLQKNFTVQWQCPSGAYYNATVPAEANGKFINLGCN